LPNWDKLNEVPPSARSWDEALLTYRSTHSYADRDVLYSRKPRTGDIFAVFLTTNGRIELDAGEGVVELRRTNEVYEAHGDGSADASGELDVAGLEITLNPAGGLLSQLYVIVVE
jgi:hypothetical protein